MTIAAGGGFEGIWACRILFQCLSFKIKENISHIPDGQIQQTTKFS
jgi:hypothetical protein